MRLEDEFAGDALGFGVVVQESIWKAVGHRHVRSRVRETQVGEYSHRIAHPLSEDLVNAGM